ncbi:MAG: hypothetical protein AAF402_08020 [Pseudomonadota bacterium]
MSISISVSRKMAGVLALVCVSQVHAADILEPTYISCISEDTASKAKLIEYDGEQKATKIRSWFANWLFGENKNAIKSEVDFSWKPVTDKGPKAKIITNEKPHNLIRVRSKTRESAIIVSSASNPMTTESWTFSINFALETMVATRVQSNMSGVRGEVLTYACSFETLTPTIPVDSAVPIG